MSPERSVGNEPGRAGRPAPGAGSPSVNIAAVSMRQDCRHYESRTYANGEMVRKCKLDLAPEAPWRCPDDCPQFQRRTFDAGWQYGSLGESAKPPEAEPQGKEVDALLDEAEDIINLAAPDILSEFEKKSRKRRIFGRKKKKR